MSVVETTKFNMQLGNAGDIFNFKASPRKTTAVVAAAGRRINKSGKVSRDNVKTSSSKSNVNRSLSKKQISRAIKPISATAPTKMIHPGEMPKPVQRGIGGKLESNPAYGEWKENARQFNANIETRRILLGIPDTRSDGSPRALAKVKVPGKPQRAKGYELPTGTGKTAQKKRRSMINRMHIEAIATDIIRNDNLSRRQKFPN